MPTAPSLRNPHRAARLDDLIPEVVERYSRRPHVQANPYSAHRCTLPAPGGRCACDCGETFDTATELEGHQHAFRQARPAEAPVRRRRPVAW